MSAPTLRVMLHELAEDAPRLDVGAAAAARAEHGRRRNRLIASAAIAVVAVAAAVSVAGSREDFAPEPPPSDNAADGVTSVSLADEEVLSWSVTDLPWRLVLRGDTKPLSKYPVQGASALISPLAPDGVDVFAWGPDGLRRLDRARLTMNHDGADGGLVTPVRTSSLSPDGKRAAFPQRDQLVVVDLTSGRTSHFEAPGNNTEVVWTGDSRQVLVGGRRIGSRLVDVAEGTSAPLRAVRAQDVAFADGRALLEWTTNSAGAGAVGTSLLPEVGVASIELAENGRPFGLPVATGSLIARTVFAGSSGATAARVVDRSNGATLAALRFRPEPAASGVRLDGCCPVLGWDGDVLLIASRSSNGVRILRWDWRSGELTRAMELDGQVAVSLSPPGS